MTSPYLYSEDTWRGFFARLRREDPEEIEDPDRFIIDRARPRQHLSFGSGIHRCVGNRLSEMQFTILWEEILKRFPPIEVVERPRRAYSNLIHGITEMKVRIPV